jgi:hypothetical protein
LWWLVVLRHDGKKFVTDRPGDLCRSPVIERISMLFLFDCLFEKRHLRKQKIIINELLSKY